MNKCPEYVQCDHFWSKYNPKELDCDRHIGEFSQIMFVQTIGTKWLGYAKILESWSIARILSRPNPKPRFNSRGNSLCLMCLLSTIITKAYGLSEDLFTFSSRHLSLVSIAIIQHPLFLSLSICLFLSLPLPTSLSLSLSLPFSLHKTNVHRNIKFSSDFPSDLGKWDLANNRCTLCFIYCKTQHNARSSSKHSVKTFPSFSKFWQVLKYNDTYYHQTKVGEVFKE